jgi:hypothetical protein
MRHVERSERQVSDFRALVAQNDTQFLRALLLDCSGCVPEYVQVIRDVLAEREAEERCNPTAT